MFVINSHTQYPELPLCTLILLGQHLYTSYLRVCSSWYLMGCSTYWCAYSVYQDLGYDTVSSMLIKVSSYVDACTRYQYSTLPRQLTLGIGIYPKLFACRYINSISTWYLSLKLISVPQVVWPDFLMIIIIGCTMSFLDISMYQHFQHTLISQGIIMISIPRLCNHTSSSSLCNWQETLWVNEMPLNYWCVMLVYQDLGYGTILGMIVQVSSFVDVCTRYQYSALTW
jgi:hypothetical protein